jgi:uncharacterized membrane protein
MDVDIGLLLKSGHLLGGVLLFSGILMSLWFKGAADKSANMSLISFSQTQSLWVGYSVILGGVGLLVVTGLMRAEVNYLQIPWLAWGFWLFVLTGLIWVLLILPIQLKQRQLIRESSSLAALPSVYKTLNRLWYGLTLLELVLHLFIAYLMIYRPYQLPLL